MSKLKELITYDAFDIRSNIFSKSRRQVYSFLNCCMAYCVQVNMVREMIKLIIMLLWLYFCNVLLLPS